MKKCSYVLGCRPPFAGLVVVPVVFLDDCWIDQVSSSMLPIKEVAWCLSICCLVLDSFVAKGSLLGGMVTILILLKI